MFVAVIFGLALLTFTNPEHRILATLAAIIANRHAQWHELPDEASK
jgi:hypothetical protein